MAADGAHVHDNLGFDLTRTTQRQCVAIGIGVFASIGFEGGKELGPAILDALPAGFQGFGDLFDPLSGRDIGDEPGDGQG